MIASRTLIMLGAGQTFPHPTGRPNELWQTHLEFPGFGGAVAATGLSEKSLKDAVLQGRFICPDVWMMSALDSTRSLHLSHWRNRAVGSSRAIPPAGFA